MLILDAENTYTFSNASVKITDLTALAETAEAPNRSIPDFNMLIPTVQPVGPTNVMELYWPGEYTRYTINHGEPNAVLNGFGPDFIEAVLTRPASRAGVYTVNLRGPSATTANIVVYVKYKIEENVPYVDELGNQYYKDENNQLTTDPVPGGEIVRDVLHLKIGSTYIQDLKKWRNLMLGMDALYSEEEDDAGYKTIPMFGVMYRGASEWGNNTYFSLIPRVAEHDGCTYFMIQMFDGLQMSRTQPLYSFERRSGEKFGLSYYIEDQFNATFPHLRYVTANDFDKLNDLIVSHLYTVDDYLNGTMDRPTLTFSAVNPFDANTFGIVMDEDSINASATQAFKLAGGADGNETRDELFKMFYDGEIIFDLRDPLRYRIPYIPDIGYDTATQKSIVEFCKKRIRTTNTTLMLGTYDSFQSAVIDHQANFLDDLPFMRQLTRIQCPMMYNEHTHRNMIYPCTYFDTVTMLENMAVHDGVAFYPMAGADARWTGFIEDTMEYANAEPDYMETLSKARINIVMRDADPGAYLSDQLMNTRLFSDQTELHNVFIISSMIYDLLDLVHHQHFKFNEADEVKAFNNAVSDFINSRYAEHSAALSCTVVRLGTTGRARYTNKLTVRIDLKDINRYTDIEIILEDN